MATVMTMRTPGGTELYDRVNENLGVEGNLPQGLIHHFAATDGNEMLIWDVWESREDFERFQNEQLMPAVQKAVGDQMPPGGAPEPTFAELHHELHR